MLIIMFARESSSVDAGVGESEGSGSCGSSGDVPGVCKPTGWKGRRIVPLLELGGRLRESHTML